MVSGNILLIPNVSSGNTVMIFCMGMISMSFSTHVCFPPARWHRYNTPGSRRALPESSSTLTTRGWNAGILVMSMPNSHTVSNGALMTTSCLERKGGFMFFPLRIFAQ